MQVANQALITSTELPDLSSDDPDTGPSDDTTITPIDAVPDLTITKTDGAITTAPGGTVTYALAYSNVGSQIANTSVLTETVPTGSTFNTGASSAGWVCTPNANAGSTCILASRKPRPRRGRQRRLRGRRGRSTRFGHRTAIQYRRHRGRR